MPMSTEAQNFYKNDFLPRYRRLAETIRKTPLAILVWGPGASTVQSGKIRDLYEKRLQIRDNLRECGHAAIFSEEIDAACPIPELCVKVRELLQAREADFVIALEGSPGSIAEVHDSAGFDEIASKMLIFIDEEAVEGYSYTGALHNLKTRYRNIETYEHTRDIKGCRLTEKIQDIVNAIQSAKWLRDNLK